MRDSETLIYLEIAEAIRRLIVSGELKPGDHLPAIREQAKTWKCTPGTVSRAYAKLAEEGLVSGRRGAGTRVTETALHAATTTWRWAALVNRADHFLLEALSNGHTPAQAEAALSVAISRWQDLQGARVPPAKREEVPTAQAKAAENQSRPTDGGMEYRLRFVGSHDLVIESLPRLMAQRYPEVALSLEYTGSLGGLIALARGNADLAGIHLWDAATDTYNTPFVQRVLPGRSVVLLMLFHRSLGLIVPSGNPQQVHGLSDLSRPEVTFVNRQAGSGTRVWLDAQLKRLGVAHGAIAGYLQTEATHVAVARTVAEKKATAGLGIEAAAASFGLGFVPLTHERYDLAFPEEVWNTVPAQSLVEIIRSAEFREAVVQYGGYDLTATGQETWL
jgi:molybdate-binding protein/DNA-binding transcriptional regulator YhcF (GntR family)